MATGIILVSIVSFILLTLIHVSSQTPFIFNDDVDFCSYSSGNNSIKMTSNIQTVKFGQTEINYKVCGKFTDQQLCPVGSTACFKDQKTGQKFTLGTEFILEENSTFKSINGDACTPSKKYAVVVSLLCSELEDDAVLMYVDDDNCTYHVGMRDPKCSTRCTLHIDGKFIDLRKLGKTFTLNTDKRNFSITLCDKDSRCNEDDANACEIIGDQKTTISLASSLTVSYVGQKNQLSLYGATYQGNNSKINSRFEVILKCDWDKESISNNDLKYVPKQKQGRKYTFELETSFGCIKRPVSCVVNDQYLIYNLSALYNDHHEMWATKGGNENRDSIYFLQVCGPIELKAKNTSCKSTHAQVCENRNGIDINRGSVLRHLKVDNDVLKATIENGMQCIENAKLQYTTIINFHCENQEQGPKFLEQKQCDTYFTWRTPHACPYYNVSRCSHVHEHYHSCSFEEGDNFYNLSALTKTTKSISDGNKEFLFNICGPVIDSDAPCMKDVSVALKYLEEVNPKYRIISLGKFFDTSIEDGDLVLNYATGSFCDGADYTSKIRLKCSNFEEEPVISKRDKCSYEFLWRTKYACPNNVEKHNEVNRNCVYVDTYSNKSIDFGRIHQTSVHLIDGHKFKYTFDLCQRNYSNCTDNNYDCRYISFEKTVVTASYNFTSIEFTLPYGCQTMDDFNKVNFRFFCEGIENNDHIEVLDTVNCTLAINYFTNWACSVKENYIPIGHAMQRSNEKIPSKIGDLPQQPPVEEFNQCLNKSPFTNHELNISNLTLRNDFLKKKCPTTVTFNDTYRFVKLFYATTDICRPVPTKNFSYEVYLKCTSDKLLSDKDDECLKHYNYNNLEYCSFFNAPSPYPSSGPISGIVIGIIATIIISSILFVVVKRRMKRNDYDAFLTIYQKDTEI